MKVFSFILILCSFFSSSQFKSFTNNAMEFSVFDVRHVFTHCLVAFPEIAFRKSNTMSKSYRNDCITANEFSGVLKGLYENNYCLVNLNDFFCFKGSLFTLKKVKLPKGKKPLVFSFDDVNYDTKKLKKGMVDKIIIDSDGSLSTSTTLGNQTVISKTNEFVPILNNFVNLHPDFSHNGAKGMLCLTGYDGILGYRTQESSPTKNEERKSAKIVAQKLKDNGWYFACHSYGHYHMKKISEQKVKLEIEKWNKEVVPLIGETHIFVYPYGEWEITKSGKTSTKHQYLVDNGFKVFCGVGLSPYCSYMPKNAPKNEQIIFMDRANIDGYTLKNRKKELSKLFNLSYL